MRGQEGRLDGTSRAVFGRNLLICSGLAVSGGRRREGPSEGSEAGLVAEERYTETRPRVSYY